MADRIAGRHKLRVKQRRRVVEYALEQGIKPSARHFGLARRTVRTWVRRWNAGGEAGLVPQYPATRKRRLPEITRELIRIARVDHRYGACASLAEARPWPPGQRRHDSTRLPGDRHPRVDQDAEAPTQADAAVREGRAWRLRASGRQGGEATAREGVSVHRDRRLHALPRGSACILVRTSRPACNSSTRCGAGCHS